MALPDNALPFGCRDVKLTPITTDAATPIYGTMVDLPASRTFSWAESEDTETLRGDDIVQAEHGNGPLIDWDLEQGGISLAAFKVMSGGAVTEVGTTPSVVRTHRKLGTDVRPYFRIDGQAINDNAGDTKVVVYRCKATGDLEGEFTEGGFEMTGASGRGYPAGNGRLWDVVQYETSAGIVQPV